MKDQSWEKEIGEMVKKIDYGENWTSRGLKKHTEVLISIIRSLLSQTRKETIEECREKIAKMERGIEWMQEGNKKDLKGYTKGYNQALSDVVEKLKEND